MRTRGSIARDEAGGYTTLREIRRYQGDPAKVDETGNAAREHMEYAAARRTVRAWLARTEGGAYYRASAAERAAVATVLSATAISHPRPPPE